MSPGKLVSLRDGAADGEITLYVKGFLGRGEEPDHFERWLASHDALVRSHGWGEAARGYHWPAGRLVPRAVVALGSAKFAWDLFRVARNVRQAARIGHWGALVAEEAGLAAAHFVTQFVLASRSARERAEDFAAELRALAESGRRVRVVAHSLGCRHVIEAVSTLEPAQRPHEIHLCAPACREDDVAEQLPRLARQGTCLYHTEKDRALDLAFTPLARGRALGFCGPRRGYGGLTAFDVSEHFDFWVHAEYKNRLARIVPREGDG